MLEKEKRQFFITTKLDSFSVHRPHTSNFNFSYSFLLCDFSLF
ncbi:hypothetical protein NC651_002356 [Populus alba x Populus x berolinensis]|nr:hypothetical protein NC651_002356 [Populus alba x Populus x berolinensis]